MPAAKDIIDQIVRILLHMTGNAQNWNSNPTLGRACIMMRIVLLLLVTFSWANIGFELHTSFNDTFLLPTSEVGLDGSKLTPVPTIQHELAEASHVPSRDRASDWSLSKALSLSFANSLKTCTGAILVLLSANAIGPFWAGVDSTLTMGFGVFLTVSLIATITVYCKGFVLKLAKNNNQMTSLAINLLRLGGGAVVAYMGAIMLLGSLGQNGGMI